MRGREKFNRYKNILNIATKVIALLPKKIRLKLFYHFRKTQGNKGLALRYILLKSLCRKCGDNVSIQPDVYIFHPENLTIGDNVSIHPMCYIECGEGEIIIGNDVSIAHAVTILAFNHRYSDMSINIKDQGIDVGKTIVNNNVWIGAKSTVLMGRVIGTGAIIAANTVVSRDVEQNTIVGGIPNRVIKRRT
ncbi:MAG: acyltransferase [Clostridia bacterium]|nr:acyltransferase [Clostridia bacterium]